MNQVFHTYHFPSVEPNRHYLSRKGMVRIEIANLLLDQIIIGNSAGDVKVTLSVPSLDFEMVTFGDEKARPFNLTFKHGIPIEKGSLEVGNFSGLTQDFYVTLLGEKKTFFN